MHSVSPNATPINDLEKDGEAAVAQSSAVKTGVAKIEATLDALQADPDSQQALDEFVRVVEASETFKICDRFALASAQALARPIHSYTATSIAANCLQYRIARETGGGEIHFNQLHPITLHLLKTLLSEAFNTHLPIEHFLMPVRAGILDAVIGAEDGAGLDEPFASLIEAMARHSFVNEYIWHVTDAENALLDQLEERIEQSLRAGTPVSASQLFALGAYRDLSKVAIIRKWVAALAVKTPEAIDPTLRFLVFNPIWEVEIAKALPVLTPIQDTVSTAVRKQYEESPYPRWSKAGKAGTQCYTHIIGREILPTPLTIEPATGEPNVLVAGCGTGQHPIGVAKSYAQSQVLAVDLSAASLAYASRQAAEMGVMNVAFAQADILRLQGIDETFDVVEAVGVIHHMKDPEAGLERLTAALKSGGFLKLGLYSRIARKQIAAARAVIAKHGYASDLEGIRAFRRDYIAGKVELGGKIDTWVDFFTTSMLRDLVFHVQEHQLTLPEIQGMLERKGLQFLGFRNLKPDVRKQYASETPHDPHQNNLQLWDMFEQRHPDTFSGMYQFWCRKL